MSIQNSDKLLVGRDGSSFQIPFNQSGIATNAYLEGEFLKKYGDVISDATDKSSYEWNKDVEVKSLQTLSLTGGSGGYLSTSTQPILSWSDSGLNFHKKNFSNIDYIYFDNEIKLRFTNTEISFYAHNEWYTTDHNTVFFTTRADSDVKEECHVKYFGAMSDDNNIVVKKYVDDKFDAIPENVPITGTIEGSPVTGDIDLAANTFVNVAGNGAGVRIKPGYWGGLKYGDELQLEWGDNGVKCGTDLNMKIGNIAFNSDAQAQYDDETSEFTGRRIHWLKGPIHKYDAVNKEYVDDAIAANAPDFTGYATETYVDTAIDNLGDILTFKGTLDFTTDTVPSSPVVGDVYVNTGTGPSDASWGLTDDVAPGEMYGRGENAWAIIGSTQVDFTSYLKKEGDTMTGQLNLPDIKVGPNSDGKSIVQLDTGSDSYNNGPHELEAKDGASTDWDAWGLYSATEANDWLSVTYGNGKFVAVAGDGTNQVMTSPDGKTWTAYPSAEDNYWREVTYGNGKFVAVGPYGTNQVMTSDDNGATWTAYPAAEANEWQSVTYGNGKFVAVARTGTNRVMTSVDGETWTAYAAAEANKWKSVIYENGKFVAVATSGTNRVMTSPDGETWTAYAAAEQNTWYSVTYGNGKFVAVAAEGTNLVMTSPDGETWTAYAAAEQNTWYSVTYGKGKFIAVANYGTNKVMTSDDGITWTAHTVFEDNEWYSITYGDGKFVAVGDYGTNRVMVLETIDPVTGGLYYDNERLLIANFANLPELL